jgi:hypothetical protein
MGLVTEGLRKKDRNWSGASGCPGQEWTIALVKCTWRVKLGDAPAS